MPDFSLACFSCDVTVPLGAPILGSACVRAKYVSHPLQVQGVVLLGAGEPIVVAAADFTSIGNDSYELWTREIARGAGTTPERVMLNTTHTHTAPSATSTFTSRVAEYLLGRKRRYNWFGIHTLQSVVISSTIEERNGVRMEQRKRGRNPRLLTILAMAIVPLAQQERSLSAERTEVHPPEPADDRRNERSSSGHRSSCRPVRAWIT